MKIPYLIVQFAMLLLLAPLIEGLIRKTKAFWQNRKGPGLFQPYHNLRKYLNKESVQSDNASWIFTAAPYLTFGAVATAALLICFTGDIILLFYILALARFFMALAGLDTGSAFGGMGSSREMFISAMVEPVMFLAFFSVVLNVHSTDIAVLGTYTQNVVNVLNPSHFLAFIAIFIVFIAETGRVPVDNPDTHLELTMVHEGMLLEYSGKPLALMMGSAMIKQMLILTLVGNVFLPWGNLVGPGYAGLIIGLLIYLGKTLALALVAATVETVNNKLRLFRVPGLLTTAFIIAGLSVTAQLLFRR